MRWLLAVLVAGLVALPAVAVPAVDGTKDADYGAAASVQTVQTQFGDNFSEWNAAYAVCRDDTLFLMLTGNLEANFNKLEIFVDSKPGGQSVFSSAGNDGAGNMDGSVFDSGFTADYHLIARRGSGSSGPKFDLDFADLGTSTSSFYEDVFGGADFGSGVTGTGVNAAGIGVGYDGSNTGGVTGGDQAADQNAALAVTTGLELSIALSDLGYTGDPIRIMVGQNNQDHTFWSNQFLGGLTAPHGNLGSPGAQDFSMIDGDQFFTVCPEPCSAVLAGLALIGLVACGSGRRRA